MKRTEMKRTPMDRRPTKRLTESKVTYRDMQALVIERDGGACVWCMMPCDVTHHRSPRGMGGSSRDENAHAAASLIALCNSCHTRVESDRHAARHLGFLVPLGIDPETYQLLWRGEWVHLSNRGTVLLGAEPRKLEM